MCKNDLQQPGVLYKHVSWYGKDKSTEFEFKKVAAGNNRKFRSLWLNIQITWLRIFIDSW